MRKYPMAAAAVLAAAAIGWTSLAGPGAAVPVTADPRSAPTGLAAELVDRVEPAPGGLVRWTSTWVLTWEPVAGAVAYSVRAVGPEGRAEHPMRTVQEPRLGLSVAAGTTTEAERPRARDGQTAYRATQLGVTVAAVRGDGSVGPPTAVVPVGARLPGAPPRAPG